MIRYKSALDPLFFTSFFFFSSVSSTLVHSSFPHLSTTLFHTQNNNKTCLPHTDPVSLTRSPSLPVLAGKSPTLLSLAHVAFPHNSPTFSTFCSGTHASLQHSSREKIIPRRLMTPPPSSSPLSRLLTLHSLISCSIPL